MPIFDDFSGPKEAPRVKELGQKSPGLPTRVGGAPRGRARPLSCGPHGAPPTSTPTRYIPFHGEKNQRESFIAFYDTEPPPSPNLSWEG